MHKGHATLANDAAERERRHDEHIERILGAQLWEIDVRATHELLCLGANWGGQIGMGSAGLPRGPTPALISDVAQVAAGHYHSCARRNDGTVACWGMNSSGELGDGTNNRRAAPTTVPGIAGAVSVDAAFDHSCAALGDGTVWCWGGSTSMQLGDGSGGDTLVPTPSLLGCP